VLPSLLGAPREDVEETVEVFDLRGCQELGTLSLAGVFLIVAVVLLVLVPSPWNIVGFAIGMLVFLGEVLFWNGRVRGQRVKVGVSTMVGRTGTVLSPCRPNGQVQLGGEIWAARCDAGAGRDESVVVVGIDGLTLVVELAGERQGRG
jgi:membrane protein implicated in regulation of membrane protease activity